MNRLSLIPEPLASDAFVFLRRGIYDDPNVDVYVNVDRSFAFLDPQPTVDYEAYVPRQAKLGLSAYKKTLSVIERRFAKVRHLLPNTGTLLEIGAADGNFLRRAHQTYPGLSYIAVEPDQNTAAARSELPWLISFNDVSGAADAGIRADFICLFHVFEHIKHPSEFLSAVRRILVPKGKILIEVPSLDDPLHTIYALPAYEAFYFQLQHPFVYTGSSLSRVLAANGFAVQEVIPYQRYGLENHLAWLRHGRPGGDEKFAATLGPIENGYRAALETKGTADTVFVIAEAA